MLLKLQNKYINNTETYRNIEVLAETLNKSIKSIIGKLSREGVYKKTVYKTKTGEDPITKKELVQEVAELLDISYESVAGLEKSPKADLRKLRDTIYEYAAAGEDGLNGWQLVWRGE